MEFPVYHEQPIDAKLHITSLYTASRRSFASDYKYTGESHDFYEIVCVASGKAGVTADNKIFMLSAGQMIVHTPNEFHNLWSDGEVAEIIIVSFGADCFPEQLRGVYNLSPDELFRLEELYQETVQTLLLNGIDVAGVKEGMEAAASILLKKLEIFLLTLAANTRTNEAGYRTRSAENYIRISGVMEKMLDRFPTAKDLAEACNLSVPELKKTVRRFAGHGAMKHFRTMKMKRADELLTQGLNVKETAYALGFSDPNYFSAVFKKYTGYSPTHWKK